VLFTLPLGLNFARLASVKVRGAKLGFLKISKCFTCFSSKLCFKILIDVCDYMKMNCVWFGLNFGFAWERLVVLAQASNLRLCENSIKLTLASIRVVAQTRSFSFERRTISLKWELVEPHSAHCSSSQPNENAKLKWENFWRLSESF